MYNVKLGRVRVTIVAVEKQYVLNIMSVCAYSLSYPACKAHALYYVKSSWAAVWSEGVLSVE
jgi:hypothetical protein